MSRQWLIRLSTFGVVCLLLAGAGLFYDVQWLAQGSAAPRPIRSTPVPPTQNPNPVTPSTGSTPIPIKTPQSGSRSPLGTSGAPGVLAEVQPTAPPVKNVIIPPVESAISDGFSSLQSYTVGQVITMGLGVAPPLTVTVLSATIDRASGTASVTVAITNGTCSQINFGTTYNAGGDPPCTGTANVYYSASTLFLTDANGARATLRSNITPMTSFNLALGASTTVTLQYLIDPSMKLVRLVYAPYGVGNRIAVIRLE